MAHCLAALGGALVQVTAQSRRPVERLLLVLPDKTRTQMAANLLLDSVLALAQHRQFEQITILYGLATHPLMEGVDIERLISRDRLRRLAQLGSPLYSRLPKPLPPP